MPAFAPPVQKSMMGKRSAGRIRFPSALLVSSASIGVQVCVCSIVSPAGPARSKARAGLWAVDPPTHNPSDKERKRGWGP